MAYLMCCCVCLQKVAICKSITHPGCKKVQGQSEAVVQTDYIAICGYNI